MLDVLATIRGRKDQYHLREHGEHREELIDRINSSHLVNPVNPVKNSASSVVHASFPRLSAELPQAQIRCAPALPFSTTNEARVWTAASGFETSATMR